MRRAGWAAGGVALLIALPTLFHGFVYDDVGAIVENPLVHSLGNSVRIWGSPYWTLGLLYRPLTVQLFALEWWLGGGSPVLFHLANAVLYALITVLVVRIGQAVLSGRGVLVAGLVFAVHPVHVEVVANGVGQSELLAGLFVLLGVERYLAWRDAPGGFSLGRRMALVACYALAIAAKETGYVLPLLLLALVWLDPDASRDPRARLRAAGPTLVLLFGVAIAALLIRIILFASLAGEIPQLPLRGLGPFERAVAMLAVLPQWVRLLLWPAQLQAHYGPPELPVTPSLTPAHLLGGGLLGVGILATIGAIGRARPLALGLIWIAVGLLPVSNLGTATGILLAERTLFLPSVGLAIAIGWGAEWLVRRFPAPAARRSLLAAGTLVLVAGSGRFLERSRIWKDQSVFMSRLERDAPGSYRAQLTAGIYYKGQARFADAERAMGRAWSLYREDPAVFEELGQLYRIQKRCREALPILEEGVVRHPEATVLRARTIECALATGDTVRAVGLAWEAIRLGQPEFEGSLSRLGGARRP